MIDASLYPTLQDAVDALPTGGTLVVPPGEWRLGAASLKSHMTLRLEPGSRLIAPDSIDEHQPIPFKGSWHGSMKHSFLGLYGVNDVTIEGTGELACQGHLFWKDYDGEPDSIERNPKTGYWLKGKCYLPRELRPVSIMLLESHNVVIRDITIRDAAAYTVWALGSDTLSLERLHLDNIRRGPNTDGLDIDCSSNVRIANCLLEVGDDCIAIKSDISLLGHEKACEHIRISDCEMTTKCCGIRIGYEGDGLIRDVIMSNCHVHDSNIGIDMLSLIPKGYFLDVRHGARIEDVEISGVTMRNVKQAIKLWSNVEEPEKRDEYTGYIRRILLSDITAQAVDSSFIGGIAVSQVELKHVKMEVTRFPEAHLGAPPVEMPNVWGGGFLPKALTIHQAPDTLLEDVEISDVFQTI